MDGGKNFPGGSNEEMQKWRNAGSNEKMQRNRVDYWRTGWAQGRYGRWASWNAFEAEYLPIWKPVFLYCSALIRHRVHFIFLYQTTQEVGTSAFGFFCLPGMCHAPRVLPSCFFHEIVKLKVFDYEFKLRGWYTVALWTWVLWGSFSLLSMSIVTPNTQVCLED